MMDLPLFFIGSLPFSDPEEAVAFVKRASAGLPFLPQLPALNPQEDPVGQILRGLEIGYWDEEASCALPYFLDAFANAYRVKIQMAGPFTVASAISRPFEELAPQWLALATNIVDQFRKFGLRSEIWLQIDEPIWSKSRDLPKAYSQFLQLAASLDRATVPGLHSCAPERPFVPAAVIKLCRFFSLNYLHRPLSEEEGQFWKKANKHGLHFVAGILPKPGQTVSDVGGAFPWGRQKIWLSTACGLSDWTPEDVEKLILKD